MAAIRLSAGNTADCTMLPAVLDAIRSPRIGPGRPRTRPDRVVADKAYSSRKLRLLLRRRNIKATIPERRDQVANRVRRGAQGGRPPVFDAGRNVVERCSSRLKQFRAIATRFGKLAAHYRAGVVIASLILWLRDTTT
ncbi:transposase [Streptomyces massasporeus]